MKHEDSEMLCNSFDEAHLVIMGHDSGDAVWIQTVDVKVSGRILAEDVKEIGAEVSVKKSFLIEC